MMKTAKKRQLGNRKFPRSREDPIRNQRVKAKAVKARSEVSSLDEWPDGQEAQPSDGKAIEEVAGLFVGAVSRHERYCQRDWQAWARN